MTQNMNEVLNQATQKIANVIQKTMSRQKNQQSKGMIGQDNLNSLMQE
jgi:hypothetical protein